MTLSAGKVCAIVACILFILAVFGVALGSLALVPLGLAFLAAAHFLS
jgi:hypothetical protein